MQLRGVDVRIALRRAQSRVPQQLLNGAQVGAALQQVRGERVPQRMRADAGLQGELRHVAAQAGDRRCVRSAACRDS